MDESSKVEDTATDIVDNTSSSSDKNISLVTPEELRSAEFGNSVENVLFSRFLYEIGSTDASSRSRAARGIGGINHELSLRAITAQYQRDNVAQVRKECIKAMSNLDIDGSIDAIKIGLKDKAPSVRLAALQGIYRQNECGGIEDVIAMLDDENALVRCRAVTCVGWNGDPAYADKITMLAKDENAPVRRAVVEAIGLLGSTDYINILFDSFEDEDEAVCTKSIIALSAITGAVLPEELPKDKDKRKALVKSWQEKWEDGTLIDDSVERDNKDTEDTEAGSKFANLSIEDILNRDDIMSKINNPSPNRATPPSIEEFHDLERFNKELLVKIKEYEYEATSREHISSGIPDIEGEDFDNVAEEGVDIISIVRELEKELDSTFDIKESLEAELTSTQQSLNEEIAVRKELEAQVELLEAQADLASQLKDEIAFIKEDRNVLSRRLGEANNKMERAVADHNSVNEQLISVEENIKSIQREKVDLEAQVINLKDKVRDLADITEARRVLEAKVRDLSSQLKATNIAKNSLELELTKIAEIGRGLREENGNLRTNLNEANMELTNLRSKLQEHEDELYQLKTEKDKIESELTSIASKYEASTKVLDAAKKSLKDIRSAALRTTEHFKDRYNRPERRRS